MEFGIFSNGFRPHTTAAQTYDEDLAEIIHADKLGFKYAFISEHHGEPVYIDKIDTLPVPELLMCKAAALTKQIRMGAAVKLIHLAHPVDTAIQTAVTDHVVGGGRFIFGFGSGFPNPLFAGERGLSHTDRHGRMRESLDLILKCWSAPEPFDWDGTYWKGKNIVATPRPLTLPHMPMATATDTEETIDLAGARGYTLLRAQLEPPGSIRQKADRYARAAKAAGRAKPLSNVTVARYVYLADSRREAMDDLRPSITYELELSEGARAHPHHHLELRSRHQGRRRHLRPDGRRRCLFPRRSGQRRQTVACVLRGVRRLRYAVDRHRQELGDAGKSVPFDVAVRRARGAEACRPRAGARS